MTENPDSVPCRCPRFADTGGYRIADLTCPVHGVNGTDPGDGYWDDSAPAPENPDSLSTFGRGGFTFTEGTVSAVVAHTWLYGNSARNSIDIVLALGLDPDMPLTDLQDAIEFWQESRDG